MVEVGGEGPEIHAFYHRICGVDVQLAFTIEHKISKEYERFVAGC